MTYLENIKHLLDIVEKEELENIKKSAKIIFDAFLKDSILQVFATGHSHIIGEEMFYRAGGLILVNPILEPFLMQHEGAARSTKFERVEGIAQIIYDSLDLKASDPFLIISNSGINAVVVEMAIIAKSNGHPVICITSKEASSNLTPRNKENKHLYEVCDIVISNHAPLGDCVIDSSYGKMGAVSTVISCAIAQMLNLEIASLYEQNNLTPAIYLSANIPGGDEHNKDLINKYKRRIKSLY